MHEIQLDKQLPLPLAEQLAGEILRQIATGALRPGAKLPAERVLAEDLQIARGTVKRAYARLVELGAVAVTQGSGSYVQRNSNVLIESRKREAVEIVSGTLERLRDMSMSDKEILNLVRLQTRGEVTARKIAVMVLSNNHGILSQLEAELAYLTNNAGVNYSLSFTTLSSIVASRKPVKLLLDYDLIVATSVDYQEILALTPMYGHKIMEATLAPRTRTIVTLSELSREREVAVVYRTEVFFEMVRRTLLALGFDDKWIVGYHEQKYTPQIHGSRGEVAVIGFNEAPMFTQEEYQAGNAAFQAAGGRLIRFEYRIERDSLLQIEDRISELI